METENSTKTTNNSGKRKLIRGLAAVLALATAGASCGYVYDKNHDLSGENGEHIGEVPEELPEKNPSEIEIIDTVDPTELAAEKFGKGKNDSEENPETTVSENDPKPNRISNSKHEESIIEDTALVIPVLNIKDYDGNSINKALETAGYPNDLAYRKKLAEHFANENPEMYGSLVPYKGTIPQNTLLLSILRSLYIDEDEITNEDTDKIEEETKSEEHSHNHGSNSNSNASTQPEKPVEEKEEWGRWEALDDKYEQRVSKSGKVEKREHPAIRWVSISDTQENGICDSCGLIQYQDHKYGEWEIISDTHKQKKCKNCGHTITQEIDHEHKLGDWKFLNNDLEERTCEDPNCNYKETRKHGKLSFIKNLFHSNDDGTHKKYKQEECSGCHHIFESEVTDSEDCRYGNWAENPNACTEERDCKDCGYQETREKHKKPEWISKDDEKEQLICPDCQTVLGERPHEYGEENVTITSNGDGKTHQMKITQVCSNCKHVKVISNKPVNCEPTSWTYKDGKDYGICPDCGQEVERVHVHDVAPEDLVYTTVTVPGSTPNDRAEHYQIGTYTCTCGEVVTVVKEGSKEACTYDDPYVQNGYEYEVDPICGHVHIYPHIDQFGEWIKVDDNYCEQVCLVTGCPNTNRESHQYGDIIDGVEICENCHYEHVITETPEEDVTYPLIGKDDPRFVTYCYEEVRSIDGVEISRVPKEHTYSTPEPVIILDMLLGLQYSCNNGNGCPKVVEFGIDEIDAIHEFEREHGLPETDIDAFIAANNPQAKIATANIIMEETTDVILEKQDIIYKKEDAILPDDHDEEWPMGDDPDKDKKLKQDTDPVGETPVVIEEEKGNTEESAVEEVVEEEEEELDEMGKLQAAYQQNREQEMKAMEAEYAELLKLLGNGEVKDDIEPVPVETPVVSQVTEVKVTEVVVEVVQTQTEEKVEESAPVIEERNDDIGKLQSYQQSRAQEMKTMEAEYAELLKFLDSQNKDTNTNKVLQLS